MFVTLRIDFDTLCKNNDLPFRVLSQSLTNHGTPLYFKQSPQTERFKKYKGWYALYENDNRIDIEKYITDLADSKKLMSIKLSEKCAFKDPLKRGKRRCLKYTVYNDTDEIVYTFIDCARIGLHKLNLPVNTFIRSVRLNKKISTGIYKNWYMIRTTI